MIISRTPFRISFFGGGTDYPSWFRQHGGAVLATTIDKYCFISVRNLPPFFEHRFRLVYSIVEDVREIDDIRHPAVRAVLKWNGTEQGLEIHHDGDLPARSGLGSSSSFTVGLLNALKALEGRLISKEELARTAIHIEQDVIQEPVGCQDQILAAFGGFNRISFVQNGSFDVVPIILCAEKLNWLEQHLMLFFTGVSRLSSEVARITIANINNCERELQTMYSMVDEALKILNRPSTDIVEFGKLLNESWKLKRQLSDRVSNQYIDDIFETALRAGAIGGKVLGAGGGGFVLFFVEPPNQSRFREVFRNLIHVPFHFEIAGSRIVLYQPSGL